MNDDRDPMGRAIADFLKDGKAHPFKDLKNLSIQTSVLEEAIRCMTAEGLLTADGLNIKLNRPS